MVITSLSVLAILSYAFWVFANNLPPEAMRLSFWTNSIRFSLFIGALLLASIGLILFTILFTYKMIKFAIRQWGEQRAPTAKDYGIMEGLHYGDGQVSVDPSGLGFRRSLIVSHYKWAAISSVYQDGLEVGMITADRTKIVLGEPESQDVAQQFVALAQSLMQTGSQNET